MVHYGASVLLYNHALSAKRILKGQETFFFPVRLVNPKDNNGDNLQPWLKVPKIKNITNSLCLWVVRDAFWSLEPHKDSATARIA